MGKLSSIVALMLLCFASALPAAVQKAKEPVQKTAPAILPSDFSGWRRASLLPGFVPPAELKDPAPQTKTILQEYGLEDSEQAVYKRGERTITVKALRFKNATGAYGAFTFYRRPEMAKEDFCGQGASEADHVLFYCSNVLVNVALDKITAMTPAEMRDLAAQIPRVGGNLAELPKLPLHLAEDVRLNAHYVSGPAGLDQLGETVNSKLVDFSFNPDVVVAKQQTPDGVATIILLAYPTPKIAQLEVQKMNEWAKAQSADWAKTQAISAAATDAMPNRFATRRSGPLVAVVTGQIAEGDARKILADINYDAEVTWSEPSPNTRDNIANLVVNIVYLSLIIIAFTAVIGIAFGGFRIFMKRFFPGRLIDRPEDVEFIKLNLRE